MTKQKVEGAFWEIEEKPWGKAVDGVQCRLLPKKSTWKAGRVPQIEADLRNRGKRELSMGLAPESWEVQFDGVWYRATARFSGGVELLWLEPGAQRNGISLLLEQRWRWQSKEGNEPLVFKPGKHTMRAAFKLDGGSVRVVSHPIEIEIVVDESAAGGENTPWGKAVEGVQCRLRAAKRMGNEGKTVTLLTEARNNGERWLHLPRDGRHCQVEVDEKWYEWVDPRLLRESKDGDEPYVSMVTELLDFESGKAYTNLTVSIPANWRRIPDGKEVEYAARSFSHGISAGLYETPLPSLLLAPGKHRIRVAYICSPSRAGRPYTNVRAVSNPVEIEIVQQGPAEAPTREGDQPGVGSGTPDADDPYAVATLRKLGPAGAELTLDKDGRVTKVYISPTWATGAELALLRGLPRLQWLVIGRRVKANPPEQLIMIEADLAQVKELTNLKRLQLPRELTTDAALAHLKGLGRLQHLTLSHSGITDAGLAHLRGLASLESLGLSDTTITDAGLMHLKRLTKLGSVDLGNTPVTPRGMKGLMEWLPNVRLFTGKEVFDPASVADDGPNRDDPDDPDALAALKNLGPRGASLTRDDQGWVTRVSISPTWATAEELALLRGLPRLESLNISRLVKANPPEEIKMTGHALVHLRGLKGLKRVWLGGVPVTDAGLEHLQALAKLEYLDLSHSQVTDAGMANLQKLTNLRQLYLSNTHVTDHALDYFERLSRLEVLDLKGTRITDGCLTDLGRLDNLKWLDLSRTKLTGFWLIKLNALRNLKHLSLDSTQLTDANLARLRGVRSLESLSLNGTKITGAGLEHLKKLPGLQRLYLSSTGVTDGGVVHLAAMAKLRDLDLGRTKVTNQRVKRLQQALPDTRIRFDAALSAEVYRKHVANLVLPQRDDPYLPSRKWLEEHLAGAVPYLLEARVKYKDRFNRIPVVADLLFDAWQQGLLSDQQKRTLAEHSLTVGWDLREAYPPGYAGEAMVNFRGVLVTAGLRPDSPGQPDRGPLGSDGILKAAWRVELEGREIRNGETCGSDGFLLRFPDDLKPGEHELEVVVEVSERAGSWSHRWTRSAPLRIDPQLKPGSIAAAGREKTGWGPTVEGVQARLRAERFQFHEGEAPVFRADVRNRGKRDLFMWKLEVNGWEIQVDGQWYRRSFRNTLLPHVLPAGGEQTNLELTFDTRWRDKPVWLHTGDKKTPLQWSPGKHSVRLALLPYDPKDSDVRIRAETNPIEIEIVTGKIRWGRTTDGLQAGLDFDLQDRPFRTGDLVGFRLFVRNVGGETVELVDFGTMGWMPTVRDSSGKTLLIAGVFDGPVQRRLRSLPAGQMLSVGSVELKLDKTPGARSRWPPHAHLEPGTYRVSQKFRFAEDPQAIWSGELTTGELELKVVPAEQPADEEVPGTLPVPRPEDMRTLIRELKSGALSNDRILQITAKVLAIQGDLEQPWDGAWGNWLETARAKGKVSDADFTRYAKQSNPTWQFEANQVWGRRDGEIGLSFDLKHLGGRVASATANHGLIITYRQVLLRLGEVTIDVGRNSGMWSFRAVTGHGSGWFRKPSEVEGLGKLAPGKHEALLLLEGEVYEAGHPDKILCRWERKLRDEVDLTELLLRGVREGDPWGPAVEGVQVRLWTGHSMWPQGTVPRLAADVRNRGKRDLSVAQAQQLCELEVDGQWYQWTGDIGVRSSWFTPGRQYENIPIAVGPPWASAGKPLILEPGKHAIRVAFIASPTGDDGGKSVRALSNPVKIEVVDARPETPAAETIERWGPAVEGVQCRFDPEKPTWKAVEKPGFKAYVRHQTETRLFLSNHPQFGARLEVDGHWHRWSGPMEWAGPAHSSSKFRTKDAQPLKITLDENWKQVDNKQPLRLDPGKHVVRFAWEGFSERGPRQGPDQQREVVLVSNPAEITILPDSPQPKLADVHPDQKQAAAAMQRSGAILAADDQGRIRSVRLSRTAVTDAGLVHLRELSGLKALYLDDTEVTGAGLLHIAGLTGLETLSVNYTRVGDAGLEHLKGLAKLTSLQLLETEVTAAGLRELKKTLPARSRHWLQATVDPLKLAGLAELRGWRNSAELSGDYELVSVDLLGPKVADDWLERLKDRHTLQDVCLDRRKITDAGLAHLQGLTDLHTLYLSGTQVTDRGLEYLKGMKKLRTLFLAGTPIGDAGLAHLNGLTNLESLLINGTQVSDAGMVHLEPLTKLTLLRLNECQVSGAGLSHLRGLTRLTTLELNGTAVADAGLVHLRPLVNLELLYLSHTSVTDAGLEHLTGLRKLRMLQVEHAHVTDQGIKQLKLSLPKTSFYH